MGKQIKTYNGKIADSSNCRFIFGEYYIKGVECFLIDGQWYRINSPNLYKDWETGWYITKKQFNAYKEDFAFSGLKGDDARYRYGIVDVTPEGDPVLGYFSINNAKNVPIFFSTDKDSNGKNTFAISEDIVDRLKYEYYNGIYASDHIIKKLHNSSSFSLQEIKRKYPYRASEVLFPFLQEYKKYKEKTLVTKSLEFKYTFGLEIETDSGIIPSNYCYKYGLMPLRDGSIHGVEYATIPLSGKEGLETIKKSFEVINKYTEITTNNSLHVHLGGFPRTMETITALYTLLIKIQDEMYDFFPQVYANTRIFKQRDYCGPLPVLKAGRSTYENKLTSRFTSLYDWISNGDTFTGFSLKEHPNDRSGEHKWQIDQRYKNFNLVPLLFGARGTFEARLHNPTIDYNKAINWIYICAAILKYAEIYTRELIEASLTTPIKFYKVLRKIYNKKISDILIEYLEYKKELHIQEAQNGDVVGKIGLKEEKMGRMIPPNISVYDEN